MQNKPATLPSNLPMPKPSDDVEAYYSPTPWRRWELSIGWKTKLYLTDEERDFYLQQLRLGKKIILIGEMVLTKQFNYLVPVRNKYKPLEPGEIRYYNKSKDLTMEEVIEKERQRLKVKTSS